MKPLLTNAKTESEDTTVRSRISLFNGEYKVIRIRFKENKIPKHLSL